MFDPNTVQYLHHNNWTNADGTCYRVRRNGRTQTWKTRPAEFRIPVKHGMYDYGSITQADASSWHLPGDETCVRICGHRNVAVVAY